MSKMVPTELICSKCGNVFRIMRRVSRQKELFHKKDLYCYICKKKTKHIEVKNLELFLAEIEFSDQNYISKEKQKVYQLIKKRSK